MSDTLPSHHLAAVWFADLVGYSALSETNEAEALRAVGRFQAIVRAVVETHGGRVVKFLGDGALAEFSSTGQAVRSADALRSDFARVAEAEGLRANELRIGVHVGDVATTEDGDLYGDGVNVASRIQAAADPGEVWVSEDVRRQLRQHPELRFASRGAHTLKGLHTPLELHAVGIGEAAAEMARERPRAKRMQVGSPQRRALALIGVGVLLAIVLIGGSQFLARGGREVVEASVAVLPFENLSGDTQNEYFSDGMTEEILNALVQVPDLRVAARTSSFAYKGRDVDVREVARELGVATVLEGSVRKEGDQLRITAQLVDAKNGFHLWSETYDRQLESVFAIQEEIAEAIARELKGSLGLAEGERLVRNRTGNMGAYELYLEARGQMRRRGQGVERAIELYEQALERDTQFAPAWAGLAEAWSLAPYWHPAPDSVVWAEGLDRAAEAAEKALKLDPSMGSAWVALGNAHRDRWEWRESEHAYRRALDLAPDDPETNQQYGQMLGGMGRVEEALPYLRRAAELDPLAAIRFNALGIVLWNAGRSEDAIAAMRRAFSLDSSIRYVNRNLTRMLLGRGRYAEADAFMEEIGLPWDDRKRRVARALAAGDTAAAVEVLRADTLVGSDYYLSALVGDQERSLGELAIGIYGGPFGRPDALWDPIVAKYRNDPRFRELIRSRNLAPR